MRRLHRVLFVTLLFTFSSSTSFSQYATFGTCTANSCHCFTLTQPVTNQGGSFWQTTKIDLNNPFDFKFNVYLGCADANGADGIVFVLQPTSTSFLGTGGGGLGYQNSPSPSLGIEIDTWQNNGVGYYDPTYDHIAIQKNGNVDHTSSNALTSYVQASASNANIEDCQWHVFEVSWDPTTLLMSVYFDNSLRTQYTGDIVATIFGGNSLVYWGFVGSTGGSSNLQQVCTVLQAGIHANISNDNGCEGMPVQLQDSSQCFSNIQTSYWNFGDGGTSPLINPPPHYYAPGTYTIKHVIAGTDGCVSDTAYKTITIGAKPVAAFTVNDVCFKNIPTVVEQSTCSLGTITQWNWFLDGNALPPSQQPNLPVLSNGLHVLQLVVITNYGCVSDTTTHTFNIKPLPQITMNMNGGCANQAVQFNGVQTDNLTVINQWHWDFGDGGVSSLQNPTHIYSSLGNYPVTLYALGTNGCSSDTIQQFIAIGPKPVAVFQVGDTCEGNSPTITNNSTIASGSISQWNWILDGQQISNSQIPLLTNLSAGNHQLQLVATSNGGCASDTTTHNFIIKNRPTIAASSIDGCAKQPAQFSASQTDNNTTIQNWNWNFGDGGTASIQNPTHTFNTGGNYNVTVTATASNGCASAVTQIQIKINQLSVNAGNDTVVLLNTPFALNGSVSSTTNSSLTYLWTPSTGLNNQNILNPTSTLSDNIIYTLTVTSAEGCIATDQVSIEVFKGSGIYVPSGFTPNHDGKNDVLRPKYIGIKTLNYFSIYNRWGQMVFTTKDMSQGWDGTIDGKEQGSGVFVWIISAEDRNGKKYELKGTTTIIR